MSHWKLEFVAAEGRDIQGITLRESIRVLANKHKVKGMVHNVKESGSVEVVCELKGDEKPDSFFKEIVEMDEPLFKGCINSTDSKMTRLAYTPAENAPVFDGFKIRREDELTEMVWALQGAGRVFEMQGKARRAALNRALRYGITQISDCANEQIKTDHSPRMFMLLAVDHYLEECPEEDDVLIRNLYTLKYYCERANQLIASNTDYVGGDNLKAILQQITGICKRIEDTLSPAKEP